VCLAGLGLLRSLSLLRLRSFRALGCLATLGARSRSSIGLARLEIDHLLRRLGWDERGLHWRGSRDGRGVAEGCAAAVGAGRVGREWSRSSNSLVGGVGLLGLGLVRLTLGAGSLGEGVGDVFTRR
jgi:hypothetical protein